MADRLKRALIVRRFAVEYTLLYGLPVHCYDTVPTAANAISQSPTSSFLLAPRDSRICFPAYYITTPTISFSPSQNCSLSLSLPLSLSSLSLSLARSLRSADRGTMSGSRVRHASLMWRHRPGDDERQHPVSDVLNASRRSDRLSWQMRRLPGVFVISAIVERARRSTGYRFAQR